MRTQLTAITKRCIVIFTLVLGIIFPGEIFASETSNSEQVKQHFSIKGKVYEYEIILSADGNIEGVQISSNPTEKSEVLYDLSEMPLVSPEVQQTIKDIKDIIVERKVISPEAMKSELPKYDRNNDGKVSIVDLICGMNIYYANPTNFLMVNDTTMELNNFIELVNYYEKIGQEKFVIRPNETVPVATTIVTTITTPRITTTTPKVTATTTKATTTTPKVTTTTTKAITTTPKVTTTTTKAITTTPKITTTTTKATTTTPKVITTTTKATTTTPKVTTTTTKVTTTTPKATTTTPKATTTTPKATTTTPKATTTTPKATTTTPKVTTTTTPTTTTTTQVTTTTSFVAPKLEDLYTPDGERIRESEYKQLIKAADTFGINEYKIVYTGGKSKGMEGSIIVPDKSFCSIWGIDDTVAYKYIATEELKNQIDDKQLKKDLDVEDYNMFWEYFEETNHVLVAPIQEGKEYDSDAVVIQGMIIVKADSKARFDKFSDWALVPIEKEIIPPAVPLDPDGWEMEQDLYEGYLQTAEFYGLKNYKIVWTEEEVPYSIIIANDSFCGIFELNGYMGVQLCPISDLETIVPGYFETSEMENSPYDFFVWRPYSVDDPINDKFPVRFEHFVLNTTTYTGWEYEHWCMIPLDENGNEVLEFLYPIKK